jgi:hypothetical protein
MAARDSETDMQSPAQRVTLLAELAFIFAFLAGAALLVVALVITLSVNVPIDDAINRWTVDTLPSDWTSIRNRWEAYHAARTLISLAGFGFVLAAVVWSRDDIATAA